MEDTGLRIFQATVFNVLRELIHWISYIVWPRMWHKFDPNRSTDDFHAGTNKITKDKGKNQLKYLLSMEDCGNLDNNARHSAGKNQLTC